MYGKLLELCVEVNKKTKSNVFLEYAGHINTIEVRVYENGWIDKDKLVDLYIKSGSKIKFKEWGDKRLYQKNMKIHIDWEESKSEYEEVIKYLQKLL